MRLQPQNRIKYDIPALRLNQSSSSLRSRACRDASATWFRFMFASLARRPTFCRWGSSSIQAGLGASLLLANPSSDPPNGPRLALNDPNAQGSLGVLRGFASLQSWNTVGTHRVDNAKTYISPVSRIPTIITPYVTSNKSFSALPKSKSCEFLAFFQHLNAFVLG